MEIELAILWVQRLIAMAVIFQTIELLKIKETFADDGVWSWPVLRKEFEIFSIFNQKMLDFFLSYRNFIGLLLLRLVLGICLLFYSHFLILFILLFSTIMISLRWRGTFNGGSDYMTVLVLASLTINSLSGHHYKVSLAVLWYLSIQLCSSYFIAGLIKIRSANWRSGFALRGFVDSTIYYQNGLVSLIYDNPALSMLMSWLLFVFELGFVLSISNPTLCAIMIVCAVGFHMGNFYIFGLNRFIFAWLSCYPALYFCSGL